MPVAATLGPSFPSGHLSTTTVIISNGEHPHPSGRRCWARKNLRNCSQCGALATLSDWNRHASWHRALAHALERPHGLVVIQPPELRGKICRLGLRPRACGSSSSCSIRWRLLIIDRVLRRVHQSFGARSLRRCRAPMG